jgi:hypothetical protein
MPDTEENKKSEQVVDIDTSGPAVDVELPESKTQEVETDKTYENERETKLEDNNKSDDTVEKSDEQLDVRTEQDDTKPVEEKTEEKKNELEEYSDGVKRRIAKLTKKMREAERQRDEATTYAKSVLQEKNQLNKRLSTLDTGYVSEMENRIKSAMEAAVSKLGKAREDGDLKSEVAAQTEISKLGYETARLTELQAKEEAKAPAREQEVRTPVQQQPQEAPINPDPKAQKWASDNSWFGTDEPMTFTAFALHKKLTEEEGYDPQTDEYYSEINKRIRLEFPHKFDKIEEPQTSKPTQTVASATRSTKTGRKTVRLTPSQVAIAKKLGVPLEEYAKQLNITKEA